MFEIYKRPLAVIALLALTACGGGTTGNAFSGPAPAIPIGTGGTPVAPQSGAAILTTIVGVGDSLTAGTQSGITMGENGTNALSALPGGLTPASQENGFFSLLFQQAKGLPPIAMYSPATSPLPLLHQPGIGSQLLPAIAAAGVPFITTHPSCDAFNAAGFALGSALSVDRISGSQATTDVAIPGITMHEALYMNGPITGPPPGPTGTAPAQTCPSYPFANPPASDPTQGSLQSVVAGESSLFYPILGGFANTVPALTMTNAAVSLKPTLTTVWLGANDMLKYIFSAGQAPISDSPGQMQADLTAIITALQNAGSRVVVANLPDVLSTSQFFGGGVGSPNPQTFDNQFQSFAVRGGVPAPVAKIYGDALAAQMALAPPAAGATFGPTNGYGVGAGGYLTESGFFAVLSAGITEIKTAAPPALPNLDGSRPGSGLGSLYLTDAFATGAHNLNLAYNAAIGAAATTTNAPLVDVFTAFQQFQTVTYPGQQISPGKCCYLSFGGGLSSFDGLHPTHTGYAFIANLFIAKINSAYGLAIPAVNVPNVYNGVAPYLLPDPYAQH